MRGRWSTCRCFGSDRRGAAAIEFAIVVLPFLTIVLMILQMGVYYMAKASLDTGVIQTADNLVNTFYSASTPAVPTPAQLKTLVYSKSGALIHNDANFYVELRQFSALSAAVLPVTNTVDSSVAGDILELRAKARVVMLVPFLSAFANVTSSSLVRRQGH